jgi:hypothetical protein
VAHREMSHRWREVYSSTDLGGSEHSKTPALLLRLQEQSPLWNWHVREFRRQEFQPLNGDGH